MYGFSWHGEHQFYRAKISRRISFERTIVFFQNVRNDTEIAFRGRNHVCILTGKMDLDKNKKIDFADGYLHFFVGTVFLCFINCKIKKCAEQKVDIHIGNSGMMWKINIPVTGNVLCRYKKCPCVDGCIYNRDAGLGCQGEHGF